MTIVQIRVELAKWFSAYHEVNDKEREQITKDFTKLCQVHLLDPDEEWLNCSCDYWYGAGSLNVFV